MINETIINAIQANNLLEVKRLIDFGFDLSVTDQWNRTPLHYADTAEMAEILVKAGLDVYAEDEEGKTALDYAIYNEEKALVKFLKSEMRKDKQRYKAIRAFESVSSSFLEMIENGYNSLTLNA